MTRITRTLREDQYTSLITARSVLLRIRNVSAKVAEKIKTHILCSVPLFLKSFGFLDNVEKYCIAGQAIDDNMVCAHSMLDT
jgi:hypothetical protein